MKIYILDAFHPAGIELAKQHAEVIYWPDPAISNWPEEADGVMVELQDRLGTDPEFAKAYQVAHEQYLADRAKLGDVPEIDGISAGGMPTRVKCLHALAGHALAAGPGVNLVGDAALELCSWKQNVCQCKPAIDVDVA
mgnify:CR=1 FL=1